MMTDEGFQRPWFLRGFSRPESSPDFKRHFSGKTGRPRRRTPASNNPRDGERGWRWLAMANEHVSAVAPMRRSTVAGLAN